MRYKDSIQNEVSEMWQLIISQLKKGLSSLENFDKDLAREVIMIENRVNSSEILIDRDCESLITMKNFDQNDLQFVMLVLKINMHLERIGDLGVNIAHHIISSEHRLKHQIIEGSKIQELYKNVLVMLDLSLAFFESRNISFSEVIFKKAENFKSLDVNSRAYFKNLRAEPENMDQALHLFSIIKNLEQITDQTKSLTSEINNSYGKKAEMKNAWGLPVEKSIK